MKTINLPHWLGVFLCCGLVGLAPLEAEVEITRVSSQPDGVGITWTAEPGNTYTLLSATSITGPWEEQTTLTAVETTLSWTNPEPAGGSHRFDRVLLPAQIAVGAELLAGAGVAQTVGATALETANLGAQGVFLASILGAGGAQLVTTGTLTQQSST